MEPLLGPEPIQQTTSDQPRESPGRLALGMGGGPVLDAGAPASAGEVAHFGTALLWRGYGPPEDRRKKCRGYDRQLACLCCRASADPSKHLKRRPNQRLLYYSHWRVRWPCLSSD